MYEEFVWSDVLVLMAAGLFVLGYLVINQIGLRLMLLLGTVLYIWYYAIVEDTPLWSAVWASTATGIANLIGLLSLFYRRSRWAIPKKFRDIYSQFDALPPGDFRKLMGASKRLIRKAGHQLTEEGSQVHTIYYVINGSVEVEKFGSRFSIPDGIFIGEVAYLTGNRASASTYLSRDSEVLEWDVAELKQRASRDPRFRLALDAMISLDLAGKVARAGSERQIEGA
ncbi:cyclic nucleotide-binding domain-containing protein [Aliiroseovarius sp. KMU-50]|uniref:Cyclic nucleotide-binding domain-containing protein n=1 Tax=Aliiroseovarius salicola TaxID=3009082 RepID=A0ABT4W283_9RHOB|nr:cyclic nucleotide-binding domain-containing protein [Aliiroseovarius sp. KMU-50]MDA5094581.1 cyclic nucleotide-binding domain-containing protein [Aliiroseovarius sp. KMU-50]